MKTLQPQLKHERLTFKHTPGPWEDNGQGIIFGQIRSDDEAETPFVADVCKDGARGFYSDEEVANGRLIAAAPEMFDALKLWVAGVPLHEFDQAARAALTKAAATCEDLDEWSRNSHHCLSSSLLAVVSVRGGLVQEVRANAPAFVLIEDWDCIDCSPPLRAVMQPIPLPSHEERRIVRKYRLNHRQTS